MQCNQCGTTAQGKYDFCPNCGAYLKTESDPGIRIPAIKGPNVDRQSGAQQADLSPEAAPAQVPADESPTQLPPAEAAPSPPAPPEKAVPPSSRPRVAASSRALLKAPPRTASKSGVRALQVRRRDSLPTVAAVVIFMGLWLVAMLAGFGAAGVYQGLQDRTRLAEQTAEQHKERAKAYLNEGNLELAFEELQYARRFNSSDPEINELLASLQRQRAPDSSGQPLPTPTLSQVSQNEILGTVFNEGKGAFDAKDYEKATSVLDGLRRVQPDFRRTEVEQMLYTAHLALARQYLTEKRYEEAVQRFDKALAIRKNDDIQLERYLASMYFRGLTAWAADWKRSVEAFAEIVRINPDYEDSRARLYQAHLAYGDDLVARGSACLAVDQFAAALAVSATAANQAKYSAAASTCAAGGGAVSTPRPGVTVPPAGPTATPTPVPGARYRALVNPNLQGTTDDTASIRGQVRDREGRPVLRIDVMVSSATKNFQRTETTDDFGFFGFDGLDPDQYTVRIKSDPASISPVVNASRRLRVLIDFLQN